MEQAAGNGGASAPDGHRHHAHDGRTPFPDAKPSLSLARGKAASRRCQAAAACRVVAAGRPLALILLLFFVLPTTLFVVVSFFDYDRTGIYPAFMLDNYRELVTTPATLRVYGSTLKFARDRLGDHAVSRLQHRLFPDLPRAQRAIRAVLFLLCAIPFLDLGDHPHDRLDPVPRPQRRLQPGADGLRLTSQPLDFLLFSDFAVIVTYVHLFTLLMVGPIANSLAKIDPALIEAARDAGASRWQTMVDVIIPLSKTGIALGSILVVTQVMGDYFVVKADERRPERLDRVGAVDRDPGDAIPAGRGQCRGAGGLRRDHGRLMMRVVDVRKELVK